MLKCVLSAVVFCASLTPVFAEGTVAIKVGYSPGGSYDLVARVIADHLGAHLPGTPDLVVENLPGAGSMKLAKIFSTAGKTDGTEIATVGSALALLPVFEPGNTDYDPRAVHYLASMSNQASFCYALKSSGLTTLDDLLKGTAKVGATGKSSATYTYPAAIKAALGATFDIVVGFEGGAEIDLAMERGEIQARCGTGKDDLLRDGLIDRVNVLAELAPVPRGEFPGVEFLLDRVSDAQTKAAVALVFSTSVVHQPFIVPPGTPADVVATLRAGFDAMVVDPEFIADAKRRGIDIAYTPGAAVEAKITALLATDPAIADLARQFVK